MCDCRSYNLGVGSVPEIIINNICLDACIADTIKTLWDNSIVTLGSCCGHGKSNPQVIIEGDPKECYDLLMRIDPREWEVSRWERVIYAPTS